MRWLWFLAVTACGHSSLSGGDASTDSTPRDSAIDAPGSYKAAVLADTPVAYYRLGETTGAVAHDEMGSNDGTITGTCVFDVAGAIAGDLDGALQLDGSTCRVTLPMTAFGFPGTAPFSIEAWALSAMDASFHMIVSKETRDAQNPLDGYALVMAPTGFTFERIVMNNGNLKTPAYLVSPGFHHLVAVFTGAEMRIYVDGSLAGTTIDARAQNAIAAPPIIGSSTVGNSFKGTIDEVAVYDKALTAVQIAAHHRSGLGLK